MGEEEKQWGEGKTIRNNSEILFIYDARMCNPNGDPDDENKPRMDYNRNINLVSDVRLKRYIRDYLMDYKGRTIFVSKVGGVTVDATKRLKKLIEANKEEIARLITEHPNTQIIDTMIFRLPSRNQNKDFSIRTEKGKQCTITL